MSDLIEREYLLNIARQEEAYGYVSEHEILNAPTAEPLVTVNAKQNEGLYLNTDEETLLETEYIVVATDGWYKEYIHETDGKPRVGKWVEHPNHIECPYCKVWFLKDYMPRNSYCPNCGSYNGGKNE